VAAPVVAVPVVAAAQKTDEAAQQEAKRQVTQPYNNAPLWREVRSGSIDGTTTTQVRGRETNILINVRGEDWRQFNRLSLWLYPDCPGFYVVAMELRLYNDGIEKLPAPFGQEGETTVVLPSA
jgi:hypothetical protein